MIGEGFVKSNLAPGEAPAKSRLTRQELGATLK